MNDLNNSIYKRIWRKVHRPLFRPLWNQLSVRVALNSIYHANSHIFLALREFYK